jgi:pimeloyl-ACP methyl ester carboxylesterase
MKKASRVILIVLVAVLALVVVGPFLVPVPPLDTASVEELAYPDSRFIELSFDGVQNVSVHYEEQGQGGLTFVLLHGFAASSFSWREVMSPLAAYGRVIALDWIPYGLTERPQPGTWTGETNPYSRAAQVDLTIALMDALGVERAILVGNSAGGAIAMQTYLEHPDRVEALILVDPAASLPAEPGAEQAGGRGREGMFGLLRSPLIQWLADTPQMDRLGPLLMRSIRNWGVDFGRSAWHNPDRLTEAVWEGYTRPLRSPGWDVGLWEAVKVSASDSFDLSQHLDEFILPVLVVTGDDDRIVPTENSIRLAGVLPSASLAVIPDAGHVPHEEQPEAFMQAVEQFLIDNGF